MTRSAGLIIIASLLFIVGLRLLGGNSSHDAVLIVRVTQFVMGTISLVAAYALWAKRDYAMKLYWLWVFGWLVGGGAVQYMVDSSPLSHVVIWWVFVGSVWLAVGAYLRSALRQTKGGLA